MPHEEQVLREDGKVGPLPGSPPPCLSSLSPWLLAAWPFLSADFQCPGGTLALGDPGPRLSSLESAGGVGERGGNWVAQESSSGQSACWQPRGMSARSRTGVMIYYSLLSFP